MATSCRAHAWRDTRTGAGLLAHGAMRTVDQRARLAHHDAMPKRILLALLLAIAAAVTVLLLLQDDRAPSDRIAPTDATTRAAPEAATANATTVATARTDADAASSRAAAPRSGQGIRGRIVDGAGKPITGAEVAAFARASTDPFSLQAMRARGQRHPSLGRATSDAEGLFAIELPDECGDARVEAHVRAPSFAPSHASCTTRVAEWTSIGDIALGRGRTLRGTVRDALTEAPLADAEVTITLPASRMLDLPPLSATTDAQGSYAIDNAPIGICNIAASAPKHARHELPQQHIQRNEDNVLDFVLQPGRTLLGVVVGRDGRACEGAFVRATPASARETGVVGAHALTDGSFRLEGVALGEAELIASAPGFSTARETIAADASKPITLQLSRLSRVRVIARDAEGRSIAGVTAIARGAGAAPNARMRRVGPRTATSTNDGGETLELEGLEPGEWTVEASAPGFARSASEPFRVDVDELREVAIVLTKGNRVLGRVLDESGRPIGGALVRLLPEAALDGDLGAALRSARASVGAEPFAISKNDGTFVLERAHDGTHSLAITQSGYAQRIQREVRTVGGSDVRVGDIALSKGAEVRGKALVAGAVDRRIVVQLTPIEAKDVALDFVAEARVAADGTFRFDGLARGRYALLAGRRDADDPFLENADQARSRVEIEVDGGSGRSVDLDVAPR
jgi:hypothetical protein